MKTNSLLTLSCAALGLAVLFACNKSKGPSAPEKGKLVYVETNDYHANQNAILAYLQKPDGSLEELPGSPFATGGAGLGNPQQILGPDDLDNPLIVSPDGRFLLAVNPGSNTIAVFNILGSGGLSPVPGSPFSSGGKTPVSLAISGRYVYVVNKAQDPLHPTTDNPSYVTLTCNNEGQLEPVPGGVFETSFGSSPAQVLVSNDQRFLFGTDFLAFQETTEAPVGSLRSFALNGTGRLSPAPGTPQVIPAMGGALGLAQHPRQQVLYVGFPLNAQVGVYSIDPNSGTLTFQTKVNAQPAACWIRTNQEGNRMYVLNSAENVVGVYNTANATAPALMNNFALKDPGPIGANGFTTSEDFSLGFSPSGKYLYVVSQHTSTDFSFGYNYLHTLVVAADGTLSEPTEPIHLPVAADIRPQGVAVD
jgi:6-phosphogluconolactonase (cycloisomerase 2 family)